MFTTILKTTGLPLIVRTLSKIFSSNKNEKLQKAGDVLSEVSEALGQGLLSEDEQKEIHRHLEEVLKAELETERNTISEVNETIRSENKSDDEYVRRMRPTFGYIMALTWLCQMMAVAYVMIFETEKAGILIEAFGALSPIWGVGLSVLGIYVYKRSEDKKLR